MSTVCIACGGTGGHLFPGLAVAEEFRRRGHEVRLMISEKPVDQRVLRAYPDYETVRLPVIGWPGLRLRLFAFAWKFAKAYWLCRQEISQTKPLAVIGMGGFLCAPPLLAAAHKGVRSYLHESNSMPGRVTRLLASRLTRVFTGFESINRRLKGASTSYVGTPVRPSLQKQDRAGALAKLGLDPAKSTMLVMGGSQGARGLNTLAAEAWKKLSPEGWQLVHLAGEADFERLSNEYKSSGVTAKVVPFLDEMEVAYSSADLIVARSGASSITEITAFGLPSVLVPYPYAADDHQTCNAQELVRTGAAVCVQEKDSTPESFAGVMEALMEDSEKRSAMSKASASMFIQDSAKKIVEEVEHEIA